MKLRTFIFIITSFIPNALWAENIIVIGQGIKVGEAATEEPCDAELQSCWNSSYTWLIEVAESSSNDIQRGILRIAAIYSSRPTDQYVQSLRLFILEQTDTDTYKENGQPSFLLINASDINVYGQYCTFYSPADIGLNIKTSEIHINDDGQYCFDQGVIEL